MKRFGKKVAGSKILSTLRQARWLVSKSEERRKARRREAPDSPQDTVAEDASFEDDRDTAIPDTARA